MRIDNANPLTALDIAHDNSGFVSEWYLDKVYTLQQGHCDKFKADINDVGIPFKLRVSLKNKNLSISWHLDRIQMEALKTDQEYIFHCRKWLSKTEDDKQMIRELPAEGLDISRSLPIVKYIVDVYTENKIGAGTDGNIFINIYGECGDTGVRPLEYSLKNQVDNFIIEAVSLKLIRKVRIGRDGIARQHLDITTYNVKIKTADVFQASTDVDVHLKIFGEKVTRDKIQLITSKNIKSKYERGQSDRFTIDCYDLGKIEHTLIGHNGKIIGARWFLNWIEIDVPKRRELYRF
ncbi:unnamed protein product [Rotaria sp. Silwood1]|nr:unnamed protein product [Rotaria sp. Silwood1]